MVSAAQGLEAVRGAASEVGDVLAAVLQGEAGARAERGRGDYFQRLALHTGRKAGGVHVMLTFHVSSRHRGTRQRYEHANQMNLYLYLSF